MVCGLELNANLVGRDGRISSFIYEGANDAASRVCLVSSGVAADGETLIIDNALVIGMDENRRVCDLELSFNIASPLLELEPLPRKSKLTNSKHTLYLRIVFVGYSIGKFERSRSNWAALLTGLGGAAGADR